MGNNYDPCFNRIDFVVISSTIELLWYYKPPKHSVKTKSVKAQQLVTLTKALTTNKDNFDSVGSW